MHKVKETHVQHAGDRSKIKTELKYSHCLIATHTFILIFTQGLLQFYTLQAGSFTECKLSEHITKLISPVNTVLLYCKTFRLETELYKLAPKSIVIRCERYRLMRQDHILAISILASVVVIECY